MEEKNVDAIYDARVLGKSKMFVLGLQHMFAMFGATVLVPAITGLNVSTTLLCAGLGTLLFTLLGEFLQAVIPLPIPAAIYGLVLLLIALMCGILKEEKVAETADFLISIMPILFVPPLAKILQHWNIISPQIAVIAVITVTTTVFIFAISGLVTKWLRGKEDRDA